MSELPFCPFCNAPVSPRATSCVLCGTPLVPVASISGAVESITGFTTDEMPGLRDDLRPLYAELSRALAPAIRISRLLGEGGMGLVFIGHDSSLKRQVAIKVLSPTLADDSVARTRFTREAEAAAAVSHPNIVAVYQVGELSHSRIPYFVMQYVEGPTLADAMGRVLPEMRVRHLVVEVASALAAAHRRRLVHRDVKPGNIVLDGETGRALVLDFGISAALSSRRRSRGMRLTTEGMYLGTPTYMSPEQASGEDVTEKSDVYSLGVVTYELLGGRPPFTGNALQILAAHIKAPPPNLLELRTDVSPEFAQLLERCLEKDPARRPTAQAVVNYLEPGDKRRVLWPPPGLDVLQRAGARLTRVLGMFAVTTLAFFIVLAAQPRITSPTLGWGQMAPSDGTGGNAVTALHPPLGGSALRQRSAEVGAVWSFLLAACVVVLGLLSMLLVGRGWAVVDLTWSARLSGYPWRVVGDVLTDQRRDTNDLRNGTAAFAFFAPHQRELLLRRRRWQVGLVLLAFGAAVGMAMIWVSGVPAGLSRSAGAIISPGEAVLVIAPVAACLAAVLVLAMLELRMVRGMQVGFRRTLRISYPPVKAELVQSWLSSTGGVLDVPRRLPPGAVFTGLVAVLSLGTAVVAAAILVVVAETTARLIPGRATAAEWIETLTVDSLQATPWPEIEATLAASALRPSPRSDLEAAGRFAALHATAGTRGARVWAFSTGDTAALPPAAPDDDAAGAEGVRIALDSLPDARTAARLSEMRLDTLGPRLTAFRRLARSALLPAVWIFKPGLPGANSPFALPSLSGRMVGTTGMLNEAAGIVALARADTATALLRARENLAVARQLTRTYTVPEAASARTLILDALELMRAVGRVARNPALRLESAGLEPVADALQQVRSGTAVSARAIFADPTSYSALAVFADTALSPATREELQFAIDFGYCMNSREVLFGIDRRRLALLDSAAVRLADLSRGAEMLEPSRRWLRSVLDEPRRLPTPKPDTLVAGERTSPVLRSLGWIGLGDVRDRMSLCRARFL